MPRARRMVRGARRRRAAPARATASASTARSKFPIPASHFQPQDVHGPSEVIDHALSNGRRRLAGRPWERRVFSKLHVGTFTPEGTFRAAIEQLDHLAATGITALELMPVADFPGRWNWGYDGVLLYAPDSAYGRPDDLKALIDAAHARGLMVFLDVVYNHFGPEGNYLRRIAPQFFSRAQTPWGGAIDYRVPEVRAFAIENALHWLRALSVRRAAARRRARHRRAGRAAYPARAQPRGRTNSPRQRPHASIWCWRTTTTREPARSARRAAGGHIARNGTTIITTPGTCSSGFPALSAHVRVTQECDCHDARRRLERMLAERFDITHTTLQMEHEEPQLLQLDDAAAVPDASISRTPRDIRNDPAVPPEATTPTEEVAPWRRQAQASLAAGLLERGGLRALLAPQVLGEDRGLGARRAQGHHEGVPLD